MAKKMLIDATHAEETRVVVVDGNKVEEFDFETVNKRQLAGNIYLAKVTRVEPSLQAAFVDYGGNRHGFLAFSEIHPDYYQIPVADREALLAEEAAYAKSLEEDEEKKPRRRSRSRAQKSADKDAVETRETGSEGISGMDVVDLDGDADADGAVDAVDAAAQEQTPEADTRAPDVRDSDDHGDDEDDAQDATARDSDIESVADEDVTEEIRQPRKPRPRRYKIQEVVKVRQILLVQVVKEERGNKGAALTTYLSLAGRYCVLMPNTARGGGISRKITNAADRKKLKEIASEIDVPKGAGLIVRTAGAKRTKTEIKRDYEYLKRMWEQIRELTLKSVAPAPIYEEGNLIKRSIRDLYNREIDEVLVEGEAGYRVAKDFMKMIMPSHSKNVKHYAEQMPLFARYQVESYLSSMFNPTVQLKSGGYIVIGVTEALVAIDVNSGRATKEGSIEDTATKTNLEAAEEVARQLRLRDLAGLIVIDFIDMEERKNNAAVEKRFKDKLKTDRARIQVGRISGFGLMEMSRQRLRPGMLEATTQPCPSCHGTGLLRSDDSLGLNILRQIEEEGTRGRTREVLIKAPVGICNFLMNQKREHVAQIEVRYGMAIRIEADPHLISPDYTVEKFKTATRNVPEVTAPVISIDTSDMPDFEEEDEVQEPEEDTREDDATETREAPEASDEPQPKKKRRRRRRRRGGNGNGEDNGNSDARSDDTSGNGAEAAAPKPTEGDEDGTAGASIAEDVAAGDASAVVTAAAPEGDAEDKPKRKRTTRSRSSRSRKKVSDAGNDTETRTEEAATDTVVATSQEVIAEEAVLNDVSPVPAAATPDAEQIETQPETAFVAPEPVAEPAPVQPTEVIATDRIDPETVAPEIAQVELESPAEQAETAPTEKAYEMAEAGDDADEDKKPKRRGWWSLGR